MKINKNISRLILSLLLLLFAQLAASNEATQADKLKAAYLYNFAKFAEWPAESFVLSKNRLVFCTYEENALNGALLNLQGRQVRDRYIDIIHLDKDLSSIQTHMCHLLYAPSISPLELLPNKPILSVGEDENINKSPHIINFRLIDNKVRFDINLKQANKEELIISSYLLKLAYKILD